MRTSITYGSEELDTRFTHKVLDLCSEMGFEQIDSDEDWADFRLQSEDGDSIIVSIDHNDHMVTTERVVDGEVEVRHEFSSEDGDTVDKVRRALL